MTTIDPSAVLAAIKARCEPGAIEQVAWEAYPRFDSDRGKRIAFRAGAEYLRPDVPLLADALQAVLDACERMRPEAPGKDASEYGPSDFVCTGQLTAINVIVETITTETKETRQ